jgi:probable rRNA maturation factor
MTTRSLAEPAYDIDVQIDPQLAASVDDRRLAEVAHGVLQREGQPTGTALTLVITTDDAIQELNRLYRQSDRPTDVLAFAAQESGQGSGCDDAGFVTADEDFACYLGDVIISYDTATAQAAEQGHELDRELALLVIHGCLHLLGYDDEAPEPRQRMWARQQELWESL